MVALRAVAGKDRLSAVVELDDVPQREGPLGVLVHVERLHYPLRLGVPFRRYKMKRARDDPAWRRLAAIVGVEDGHDHPRIDRQGRHGPLLAVSTATRLWYRL